MIQPLSHPPKDAHIAACGLFCTNCGKFAKGSCAGCQEAPGFGRCAVRLCCAEKHITNCAECPDFKAPRDYRECKKVHNVISRVISLFTGSDRPSALALLRDKGQDAYLAAKRASGKM